MKHNETINRSQSASYVNFETMRNSAKHNIVVLVGQPTRKKPFSTKVSFFYCTAAAIKTRFLRYLDHEDKQSAHRVHRRHHRHGAG